jgi:hypothetical protein
VQVYLWSLICPHGMMLNLSLLCDTGYIIYLLLWTNDNETLVCIQNILYNSVLFGTELALHNEDI